jgi:hypothetical protein
MSPVKETYFESFENWLHQGSKSFYDILILASLQGQQPTLPACA